MSKRSHIVALAAVFALTGVSVIGAAQQRPNRASDQQIGALLSRIDGSIATFRTSFDRAIDRSRINGSRAEDDINQSVSDFKQATERLRDRVQDRRAGAADVEDVLRRASVIDGFMTSHALDVTVERDWQSLRGDLDELARAYGVTRNWTGAQGVQSRVNDEQVKQLLTRTKKNADQFRRSLDRALDRSRIDGSREEDNINQFVIDFAEATDHLSDHFDRRQVVTNDVEDVLRRGVSIDSFMQRHQLVAQAENDWLTVRRDLDELARAYNVAWDWSTPRYTAVERSDGLYHRLTGTYQLERSRGEDPASGGGPGDPGAAVRAAARGRPAPHESAECTRDDRDRPEREQRHHRVVARTADHLRGGRPGPHRAGRRWTDRQYPRHAVWRSVDGDHDRHWRN